MASPCGGTLSSQPHEKARLDESLNVSLPNKELAVLCQIDRAVLGLNLSRVLEHSNVNEEVLWRLQAARQIDIRELCLVLADKLRIRVEIRVFFWRKRILLAAGSHCTVTLARHANIVVPCIVRIQIFAFPDQTLELIGSDAVVGQ
jgi:hypothetical protein